MTELQIIFLIFIALAIFETVLQLSIVSWYFKYGFKVFTSHQVISDSIKCLPQVEKYDSTLKSNGQKVYLRLEEIDSEAIAMRFKYTPLSNYYGIMIFNFQDKVLIQKVYVSWLQVLFLIFLAIIVFIENVFFGLVSIIIIPLFIMLQFSIVKERFKTAARIFAN